jgi:hypothetical protein
VGKGEGHEGATPAAASSAREKIDADGVFPFVPVLIYGLFFTLLIAVLDAAAHLRLRAGGEKLGK